MERMFGKRFGTFFALINLILLIAIFFGLFFGDVIYKKANDNAFAGKLQT